MKVLHLIATNFVGGPEKQILTHARYVNPATYRLHLGSFLEGGAPNEFLKSAKAAGIPTLAAPQRSALDISPIGAIREYLAREGIDVLVTHGYKSNIFGALARGNSPVGHAMYVRGWTDENFRVRTYNSLERVFLPKAHLVVTVARRKMDELASLGVKRERLRYIPNAVEAVSERDSAPNAIRDDYRIPSASRVIAAAGRLSPEKGHEVLLDALKLLAARGLDFHCVIFGDGPLRSRLEAQAAATGRGDRIHFAGFVKDWTRYLPDIDVLVNPSHSEVMPNVVLECMMRRCVVVATDVGGVDELVLNGETGYLVPAGDPGAIAGAVKSFLGDGGARSRLVENAHRHVLEHFSFEHQARMLEALYEELHAIGAGLAGGAPARGPSPAPPGEPR